MSYPVVVDSIEALERALSSGCSFILVKGVLKADRPIQLTRGLLLQGLRGNEIQCVGIVLAERCELRDLNLVCIVPPWVLPAGHFRVETRHEATEQPLPAFAQAAAPQTVLRLVKDDE